MASRLDAMQDLVQGACSGQLTRRQFLQRAAVLGLSVSAAGSLLAACGGGSSSGAASTSASPQALGTLTARSTLEVGTLDPANWSSPVDVYTLDAISEGLVSYKPGTWEVVNTLAETFEPTADGLSYKFTLKQGIPFHRDYGEVTAFLDMILPLSTGSVLLMRGAKGSFMMMVPLYVESTLTSLSAAQSAW